jgi:hypothetical protein
MFMYVCMFFVLKYVFSSSWEQPKYARYFLNRVRMCQNVAVLYFNLIALYFAVGFSLKKITSNMVFE